MATKTVRIGSLKNIHQYDDGDYDKSMEVEDPIKCTGTPTDSDDLIKKSDLDEYTVDFAASINGTVNRVTVTYNGDGTVTLTLPDNVSIVGLDLTGERFLVNLFLLV